MSNLLSCKEPILNPEHMLDKKGNFRADLKVAIKQHIMGLNLTPNKIAIRLAMVERVTSVCACGKLKGIKRVGQLCSSCNTVATNPEIYELTKTHMGTLRRWSTSSDTLIWVLEQLGYNVQYCNGNYVGVQELWVNQKDVPTNSSVSNSILLVIEDKLQPDSKKNTTTYSVKRKTVNTINVPWNSEPVPSDYVPHNKQ